MDFKNWRQFAFLLGIIGCLSYIILTFIAMFFYGGGTVIDPTSEGFSLIENYFGDLILKVSRSGQDNTISSILASTGSILLGLFLIPSFLSSFQFFTTTREKIISGLGILFGVLMAVDFILLIIFYYTYFLAFSFYIFLLLTWCCYLIAFFLNKQLSRKYVYLLLIALVIYVISVPFYFHSNHILVATSQKIIWYDLLAYYILSNYFMIRELTP